MRKKSFQKNIIRSASKSQSGFYQKESSHSIVKPHLQSNSKTEGKPQRSSQLGFKKHSDSKLEDHNHSPSKRVRNRASQRWKAKQKTVCLKATVDKNRKGFAFLVFEDSSYSDAFVSPEQAQSLFPGDRVEVVFRPPGAVLRIKVIEHALKEVVGKYTAHPRGGDFGGWVIFEKKKAREEIYIPHSDIPLTDGHWIRVELEFKSSGPHPVIGQVIESYGVNLPPSADLSMVAAEYSLSQAHSTVAIAEAQSKTLEVPGSDLEGREDLRHVPFITIDGVTARDFDDAVYVERKGSGFLLWVAIADVSHYVEEGSVLDQEAYARGTSVYFPEKAFHMLPRELSENLCSLKPNEPRLAMVAKIEFDSSGMRTGVQVVEGVIQSRRRATYEEIYAEWQAHQSDLCWEYQAHFALYQLLKRLRSERGSIDFEFPEAEVLVAPTGEVYSISVRPRVDSHRLIEEFMIAANEAVTAWMIERRWPFVYRIHEEPSLQSLEKFKTLAASVGMRVDFNKSRAPKVLADLVRKLEGHPAQALLSNSLLRSMKQAVYSSTHGIHYGLASEGYTHFTSPIRRYPDLVVHRLIRMVLRSSTKSEGQAGLKSLPHRQREELEMKLAETCEHCSYRERLAAEAERESIRIKQVRLMQTLIGREFLGRINGVSPGGAYVQMSEPYVEGFIPVESLGDDFFEFIEDKMILLGRRSRRVLRIGEEIKIQVVRADLERRQVEFALADSKN